MDKTYLKTPCLNNLALQENPWNHNSNPIWLASAFFLIRNIEKFNFPTHLDISRKNQLIEHLEKQLTKIKELNNPVLLKIKDLQPVEREFISEHFLTHFFFKNSFEANGYILDDTGEVLITLNEQDHLHIEMVNCSEEIEKTWNKLVAIETEIGKYVKYAFSSKFGFLTADPSLSGTGFVFSAFLQPSALKHLGLLEAFIEKHQEDMVVVEGLQGSLKETIGDMIIVRNHYTLGSTEEHILISVKTLASKIVEEETLLREKIKKEDHPELKDKVSRAYAVLLHSYQIDAAEALDAISLVKLGVALGWVKNLSMLHLNMLFFSSRRAHLLSRLEGQVQQKEILHKRAELVHHSMQEASLEI